jgi:hypothetical protein
MKHTPGPWRLSHNGQTIVSNQSHPVATLSDPFHRQCEWGTGNDGPLIAAAPDLLAALQELCNRLGPRWFLEQNWAAPLEAIEKATLEALSNGGSNDR